VRTTQKSAAPEAITIAGDSLSVIGLGGQYGNYLFRKFAIGGNLFMRSVILRVP
jgi:hypothetical protein